MRIGICAPSTPFTREDAERVVALAAAQRPDVELVFDDQCFAERGHFAGSDEQRLEAFVRLANDPGFDAIWFARGGYGACRIAQDAVSALKSPARRKTYLGYSDQGNLLGALYKAGIGWPVHGPMPADIRRTDGDAAVTRALDWLADGNVATLEPHLQKGPRYAAFNLMTLAMLAPTPLLPDLRDHVLLIEEVSEYLYAFDRAMFSVTTALGDTGLSGLMLGRVSDVPENDRPFGADAEEIAQHWCAKNGIAYLGRADIGHDSDNKIVPFGLIG